MSQRPLSGVLRYLRQATANSAGVPDARLLERFALAGDAAAFELLVWRHGPMVHGVCRRLLRQEQDAEDAFQAAFLALARRAHAVGRRGSVGGWLYRVAYRVALDARGRAAKRCARERPVADLTAVPGRGDPCAEAAARELWRALDDEVNRLPERYRIPFVLCCLQGRSNAEAAREVGCLVKTIESRLARARARLRARLVQRGFCVPAGLTGVLLSQSAVGAGVPPVLVAATLRAATTAGTRAAAGGLISANVLALTEGVLRVMFVTKLKLAAAVLLAAVVATGVGGWGYQAWAADGPGGRAEGLANGVSLTSEAAPQAQADPTGDGPQHRPPADQVQAEHERILRQLHKLLSEQFHKQPAAPVKGDDHQALLRQLQEQLEAQQREQKRTQELLELLHEHLKQYQGPAKHDATSPRQRKALQAIAEALAELRSSTRGNPGQERAVEEFTEAYGRLKNRLEGRPVAEPPPKANQKPGWGGEAVQGEIRAVSADAHVVQISIGSDSSLQTGQTLHVYRTKPQPAYLGEIVLMQVEGKQAVAKVKAPSIAGPIQVGDHVTTILAGR
jgi:RNA polymerase sigma factor (sigma-70 family)